MSWTAIMMGAASQARNDPTTTLQTVMLRRVHVIPGARMSQTVARMLIPEMVMLNPASTHVVM